MIAIRLVAMTFATTLVLASAAAAVDKPLAARELVVTNRRAPEDATKRRISWLVMDPDVVAPAPGGADDPRCIAAGGSGAGGTIRFFSDGSGGSFEDTGDITLPC